MAALWNELSEAHKAGSPFAVATVAAVRGSVPREAGAKMLIFSTGKTVGTVGGGKFEALVVEEALSCIGSGDVRLKVFPLHEGEPDSFGAICGGEVTVLFEPHIGAARLVVVGAGHCGRALAEAGRRCGFRVVLVDERAAELERADEGVERLQVSGSDYLNATECSARDALVLVNRNYEADRDALRVALAAGGFGYIGMIGSRRKVRRVFDELRAAGVPDTKFADVYAPIGLDIGADSPEEIAVSVLAEVLAVLRGRSGEHLRKKLKN